MDTCKTCGADTYVDFRTRTLRCRDCSGLAIRCTCAPVPLWRQRAMRKPHGLAKDLSGMAA